MAASSPSHKIMKSLVARSVVLLKQPVGVVSPKIGEDIGLLEQPAPGEAPPQGVLVRCCYFSVDPYLRSQMAGNIPLNSVINGFVSGKVIASKNPEWKEGDLFGANLPFTSYQQVDADRLKGFRKLTGLIDEKELSLGIGILGMPGSTAYAGLDLMGVNENDRVWISAATGAVGSIAAQIAKNVRKCKIVIGTAGSKEKCEVATKEFGYDACVNYKDAKSPEELAELIKKHSPEGIDFYFENVGGDHFAAAMKLLRLKGRIAVCGAIAHYNHKEASFPTDKVNLAQIIYQQQRVEGFLCGDWLAGKRGNFLKDMSSWHKAGLVKHRETVFEGVSKWPEAFHALFVQGGDNLGKIVVKIEE